jgi:hypothetical protein
MSATQQLRSTSPGATSTGETVRQFLGCVRMAREPEPADDPAATGSAVPAGDDVGEARWPMAGAVVAAIVLTILLPEAVRLGPRWLLPLVEGVLLIAVIVGRPCQDQPPHPSAPDDLYRARRRPSARDALGDRPADRRPYPRRTGDKFRERPS